jgi:diacylglycerol kinase (ATP)
LYQYLKIIQCYYKHLLSMKFAKLLHNPGAGDGEHSPNNLLEMIEAAGFDCSYSSTKKLEKTNIKPHKLDLVILAGGDGTVRKVAPQLLQENLPIGLLPMGTANNIAKTLGIATDPETIIENWTHDRVKTFDLGHIYGLDEPYLFLEGFGFGIFPLLMDRMKKFSKEDVEDPNERLQIALKVLHDIVNEFEAVKGTVKIDGNDHSGKFLLIEVMNIKSIGPNLNLAPEADPGDGFFDVVLIPEDKRKELADYVMSKIKDNEQIKSFATIRAKSLKIYWEGDSVHADDEKIKIDKPREINVNIQTEALKFLIP